MINKVNFKKMFFNFFDYENHKFKRNLEPKYYYSLLKRFISIIFLIFCFIFYVVWWNLEVERKQTIIDNLEIKSSIIDQKITKIFKGIESKLKFLGYIISYNNNESNYNEIKNLLDILLSAQEKSEILFFNNFVSWVDSNNCIKITNNQIVDANQCIKEHSFQSLKNSNFKLIFDKFESTDIINNSFIRAGIGINNKKGDYIGGLIFNLNLYEITKTINKSVNEPIKYFLLYSVIDKKFIIESQPLKQNLLNIIIDRINQAETDNKTNIVIYQNDIFAINKLKNLPFILVTSAQNLKPSSSDFLNSVKKHLPELSIAILLCSIIIYLFYSSILRPFLALSYAAFEISKGNLDVNIKSVNSYESALVADALENIKEYFIEQQKLLSEITNTKNALAVNNLNLENIVLSSTRDLEELLKNKTNFIGDLSHQVKTPLTGITEVAENLIKYWVDFSEQKRFEFAHQIAFNSKKLLALIINLVDISKYYNGKIILSLTKVDLAKVIDNLIQESRFLYSYKKNIEINFHFKQIFYVIADYDRISQVIRNLIVNAIKFSPDNSSITISLNSSKIESPGEPSQEAVLFSIQDQGQGLNENELESIFFPFLQHEKNIQSNKNISQGIGLTICREIIFAHGGIIWASVNKDGGATFQFKLRLDQGLSSQEPKNIDVSKLEKNKYNILMIDDDETSLNAMECILFNTQYNLITFSKAIHALEYLKENSEFINLILIDLLMPDFYGLNLLNELKQFINLNYVPIILQTGSSDQKEISKALDSGIFAFIRKPYNKDEIIELVGRAIMFQENNRKL